MGNTALMGVCFRGYINVAILLISHTKNINLSNYNGATALTFAATYGHADIVKYLLKAGADKTISDKYMKNTATTRTASGK